MLDQGIVVGKISINKPQEVIKNDDRQATVQPGTYPLKIHFEGNSLGDITAFSLSSKTICFETKQKPNGELKTAANPHEEAFDVGSEINIDSGIDTHLNIDWLEFDKTSLAFDIYVESKEFQQIQQIFKCQKALERLNRKVNDPYSLGNHRMMDIDRINNIIDLNGDPYEFYCFEKTIKEISGLNAHEAGVNDYEISERMNGYDEISQNKMEKAKNVSEQALIDKGIASRIEQEFSSKPKQQTSHSFNIA